MFSQEVLNTGLNILLNRYVLCPKKKIHDDDDDDHYFYDYYDYCVSSV